MNSLIKLGVSFVLSLAVTFIILFMFAPHTIVVIALTVVLPTLLINCGINKLKIN